MIAVLAISECWLCLRENEALDVVSFGNESVSICGCKVD